MAKTSDIPLSTFDAATAAVDLGNQKLTNVADPTSDQDGATKGYVDDAILLDEALQFVIDGGGSVISTGIKGDLEVPFDCEISQVTLLADQSGSIQIDIWKDSYANFPPVDADSITASAEPAISSADKSQDSTLSGWTTALSAGDILRFNVDSATTIQRVTVSLQVTRT
jgi:hypothetical protein